jgi:hypothetical protein
MSCIKKSVRPLVRYMFMPLNSISDDWPDCSRIFNISLSSQKVNIKSDHPTIYFTRLHSITSPQPQAGGLGGFWPVSEPANVCKS